MSELERRIWGEERPKPEEQRGFSSFAEWQNTAPLWPGGVYTAAGPNVSIGSAAGLPTVATCIRLLAETTGGTPLEVLRTSGQGTKPAEDTWQWIRLHDHPNDEQSAYEFFRDAETSLCTTGNVFIWKAKARPVPVDAEDIQLRLLDSTQVIVIRENGRKLFKIGNDQTRYDRSTILHIRGWSLSPQQEVGSSPIALHRESLGGALAMEEFGHRFYTNGGVLSGVIEVPGQISREKANDLRDDFAQHHAGLTNAHKPAVLYNGAKYAGVGINPADAQYIQSKEWTVPDIARMFRISAVGLITHALGTRPSLAADDLERFVKFDLPPRLWEIQSGLKSDPDLFGMGSDLFPRFDPDMILKSDLQTRYAAYKDGIQAGWLLPDEVRGWEHLPELPADLGKIPQITPVGGAPNPPPHDGGSSNGKMPMEQPAA